MIDLKKFSFSDFVSEFNEIEFEIGTKNTFGFGVNYFESFMIDNMRIKKEIFLWEPT